MTMGIGALSSLFGHGQSQGAQDGGNNGNMMQEIAQLLQAIEQLLDSSSQGQNGCRLEFLALRLLQRLQRMCVEYQRAQA